MQYHIKKCKNLKLLEREVKCLELLRDRGYAHIVRLICPNIFVDPDLQKYIYLEKASLDLFDYIKNDVVKPTPDECMEVSLNLLVAVRDLHVLGYAHMDIKPENILLFIDPNSKNKMKLKLCDIPQLTSIHHSKFHLIGTRGYMAPEMCVVEREDIHNVATKIDPIKIDAWSSGVTIYNLFLNHMPFNYANDRDWFFQKFSREQKVKRKASIFPSDLSLQQRIDVVLHKSLLCISPNERYDMHQALNLFNAIRASWPDFETHTATNSSSETSMYNTLLRQMQEFPCLQEWDTW